MRWRVGPYGGPYGALMLLGLGTKGNSGTCHVVPPGLGCLRQRAPTFALPAATRSTTS